MSSTHPPTHPGTKVGGTSVTIGESAARPSPDLAVFGGPSLAHGEPAQKGAVTFGTAVQRENTTVLAAAAGHNLVPGDSSATAFDARRPKKRAPQHAFPTAAARATVEAAAAVGGEAELAHSTPRVSLAAASFGSVPRGGAALDDGFTSHGELLPAELPKALRPGRPSARFGSAAARPSGAPQWQARPDAPDLDPHAARDAIKPRGHGAVPFASPMPIDPTVAEKLAANLAVWKSVGAVAADVDPPGPGSYKPSLELVTKRTPVVSLGGPAVAGFSAFGAPIDSAAADGSAVAAGAP